MTHLRVPIKSVYGGRIVVLGYAGGGDAGELVRQLKERDAVMIIALTVACDNALVRAARLAGVPYQHVRMPGSRMSPRMQYRLTGQVVRQLRAGPGTVVLVGETTAGAALRVAETAEKAMAKKEA